MEEWLIRIYSNGTKALIMLFQQTKQLQSIPWKVDDFIAWELLPFLAILFALVGAIYTMVRRRQNPKSMMANNSNTAIIILTILNSAVLISVTLLICWLLKLYIWGI